jgi:hypothetical protein
MSNPLVTSFFYLHQLIFLLEDFLCTNFEKDWNCGVEKIRIFKDVVLEY